MVVNVAAVRVDPLPGGRLAAVHAVLEGECVVSLVGEPAAVRLSAGDVVVLGAVTNASARLGPVLTLVRAEAGQPAGVSAAVLRRAAEALFIQALRGALLDASPASGWLAAASDPRRAPALAALHEQPEHRWTLPELAGLAHLSRTAFFGRFQACMGQTPAEYLQWWRLQLAAQRLRETQDSVVEIAMAVGYDNASAFARVFKPCAAAWAGSPAQVMNGFSNGTSKGSKSATFRVTTVSP